MLRNNIFLPAVLLTLSMGAPVLRAQTTPKELVPLPIEIAPENGDALRYLWPLISQFTPATPKRIRRHFFRPLQHPLTPKDVAFREAVRTLGIDKHRFVHCELKDHVVVTGAIASIGDEGFFVQSGILGKGRRIHYSELNAAPRPVPAVGTHLKVGLEWTGFVGACVVLLPLVIVFIPLIMAGVIQD